MTPTYHESKSAMFIVTEKDVLSAVIWTIRR